MAAPTLGPDPLMTITVELRRVPTGASPCGERSEVFFDGTATAARSSRIAVTAGAARAASSKG